VIAQRREQASLREENVCMRSRGQWRPRSMELLVSFIGLRKSLSTSVSARSFKSPKCCDAGCPRVQLLFHATAGSLPLSDLGERMQSGARDRQGGVVSEHGTRKFEYWEEGRSTRLAEVVQPGRSNPESAHCSSPRASKSEVAHARNRQTDSCHCDA
jgi:hypothetical protein